MSFVIEDDDHGSGFGGGGGGDIYDIDLGEPLGARTASSAGAAKRSSVSAAAPRSTKVAPAGGGGVTSVTDKASYYLAKLKADKAKAAAAAPRWVETAGGSTNTLLYCRPPPHPPRRPAVPSTVVSHARTTDTSGGPAAPSSSHGPPPTTPSRTSELGLLRGGFSIGVAASDPATNRVTPAIAAAAISGPVHVPLPSATLVAKGSDSVSRGNAPMAGADRGPAPAFLPGQRVASRFGGGEEYFPGVVEAVNDDGTFVVRYDDGDVEEAVPVERLAPEGSVQVEALLDDGDRRESIAAVSAAWAAADMRAPLVPPAVAALAAARSSSDSRAAHVGERRDYPEPVIDAIPEEESEASAVRSFKPRPPHCLDPPHCLNPPTASTPPLP